MSACAYLRKSREDEERERVGKYETLARHQRQIEALSHENGVPVSRWYKETASGETIAARPVMTELLRAVAHGEWDAVYCMEAARLGRGGGVDQEAILNAFRYTGTLLVTPDKTYRPDSPGDMRLLKKELQSSEDELETINMRLTRGKHQAAREGIWQSTGRTPYGWRAVRVGLDWTLEPDENHHHMLRIYDLLEQGMGWATIAGIYNAEGVPRSRGGKRWTPSAVQAIARNPANCGMVTYAKNTTVREFDPETFRVVKKKVKNPNPIIVPGLHMGKGGISQERFERIIGDVRLAKVHKERELVNPLATLLVCGECGYSMVAKLCGNGKSARRYYAHKPDRAMTRPCKGCKNARMDAVLDGLLDALQAAYDDTFAECDDGAASLQTRRDALAKDVERLSAARERALDAYEAGAYTLEELTARKEAIDTRMRAAMAEIGAIDAQPEPEAVRLSIGECIGALRGGATPAEVNAALRSVISRIEYRNDGKMELDVFLK